MTPDSVLGKIEVSPRAIASLASDAVLRCYGVVGMAAGTVRDGIAEILQVENSHRGVEVHITGGEVSISLHIVVEYGMRISEVAQNVMDSVKFAVEKALGMPVEQVNVHVEGIRVSNEQ